MLDIKNTKYIIFDLDGTLIDTEKLYNAYWQKACAMEGFSLSYEEALNLRSLDAKLAKNYFRKLFGKKFNYDIVRAKRKELMREHFEKIPKINTKPYTIEFLSFLVKKGVKHAICSASEIDSISRHLHLANIPNTFTKLISAKMIANGKPNPDVYLYACEELNVLPSEVIAIEDAPNGVISAKKAGCQVVMIPDLTLPNTELAKYTDCIVKDFKELLLMFETQPNEIGARC